MPGMDARHPLDKAADALGGAAELALILGVTAQAISNWKGRGVPIERCLAIERATAGSVSRRDLREDWPDIWPELADRRAADTVHPFPDLDRRAPVSVEGGS